MTNTSNKELVIKAQDIFEAFYRTNYDPDLAVEIEKFSGFWSLNYRIMVHISDVAIVPKC